MTVVPANLIARLNGLITKSPDQIAQLLGDPFATWQQGDVVTPEIYARYGDSRIVILSEHNRSRPNRVEYEHRIGSIQLTESGYHTTMWTLDHWQTGILRAHAGGFWFRSKESYDANPDEGF